jgi:hypothetical protein
VASKFCQTPEEMADVVEEFRMTLTPEKCQKYINKLHEVNY